MVFNFNNAKLISELTIIQEPNTIVLFPFAVQSAKACGQYVTDRLL